MSSVALRVLTACALLLCAGCVSMPPKLVRAEEVPICGIAPLYHTAYIGSDAEYHYFAWERGFSSGEVKVLKTELKLSREFPKGTDWTFAFKTPSGSVDVMPKPPRPEAAPKP